MSGWETVGATFAIIVAIAGLLKYVFYLLDKHKDHVDDLFKRVDGRFKEQKQRLDKHDRDIHKNESLLQTTREEIQRDFVRHDQLDKQMNLHNDMLTDIFSKLNEMARDLNRLIGAHNKKVDDNDDINS